LTVDRRPAGNGQAKSNTWPIPQAQTTEAGHLMSLWLSSPKSKNTTKPTKKPNRKKKVTDEPKP